MKKDETIVASVIFAIGIVFGVVFIFVESIVAKWIWGILSLAFLIFGVIVIVDAIIKNRRKPKSFTDLLMDAFENQSKQSDFGEILRKRLDESANRRRILFYGQKPYEDDYGYVVSNPIMTSGISSSEIYLSSMRTNEGKKFTWERLGSCCVSELSGIECVMVDKYQLFLDGIEYKTIYICPYGFSSSYAPKGMKISEIKEE